MAKLYGWAGKMLRVDLSEGRISLEDTTRYTKRFIGGRGICAKIAWDEVPSGIDAFDPENRLLIMAGPLSGTLVSGSGRVQFAAIAPQVYPAPRYTRSSMGGNWAAVLKYAGYDGLIIQGRSEKPVFLCINDDEVKIKDAARLWGLDTFETQRAIMKEMGSEVSAIVIGQAGENLCRIAIINNETENAAGQGGFGAVMGSKRLKAVAVKGTGSVKVADPERFLKTIRRLAKLLGQRRLGQETWMGQYKRKTIACHGCLRDCSTIILNVPGRICPGTLTAKVQCVGGRWLDGGWRIPSRGYKQDYRELPKDMPRIKDLEASFEAKVFGDRYGLNMWEITLGLVPWLKLCKDEEIITEKEVGMPFEVDKGEFWSKIFRMIAYREGFGDVLAEGMPRAADMLGKGHKYLTHVAHGYVEHWLGRGIQSDLYFPFWVISALTWATDSRDPYSDHHRSYSLGSLGTDNPTPYLSAEQARTISKRLYGSEKTLDLNYECKAQRVVWHQNRCCVDESLILCETGGFPLISSSVTEDGFGYPEAESDLFSAVTGVELSEAELDRAGERVFNVERAIMVREGRSREYDVRCGVIAYMTSRPDRDGVMLDEEAFLKSLEEYYRIRGWDVATGWPKGGKLDELELREIADELGRRGLLST